MFEKARLVLPGSLLLSAILLSIAAGLGAAACAAAAGGLFWLAGLLLVSRVRGLQRIQVLVMLATGTLGMAIAAIDAVQVDLWGVLTNNQALLAMLGAVSFLRLISLPHAADNEAAPRARGALWRTLLGVHLFGAVINLSAVMILGERQSAQRPLTPLQATVLSRGFSLAAHWSPFFAAMGVALGNAPGAALFVLSGVGLPLAAFALLVSGWQLSRREDAAQYVGYPMHFGALWIPAVLAMLVLAGHHLWPVIPVLTLISLLSILQTLVALLSRDGYLAPGRLAEHVRDGLPRMSGELVLFLAAGVLAVGIGAGIEASGWRLELAVFGPTQASVLLVLMVGASVLGVHPVISIATAHGLLTPLAPDPDLMGITYLMTWAAGVSSSPFSGMHLAMQGGFGIDPWNFLRWNGGFTLFMLLVDACVLHVYGFWQSL